MKVLRGFEVPGSRSRNWDPSGERGPGHTGHRQTTGPCSPLPPPTGGSLHKHRGPGERDLRGLQYMGLGRKTRGPGRVGMCSRPRCRIVFSKTWEHCTKTDRENQVIIGSFFCLRFVSVSWYEHLGRYMYERQVSSETPYIVKLKLIQPLYKVTSETLDFHSCKQNPTSDTP